MSKTKKNPLVGKEVWTLVITNDYGIAPTTISVHTSFQKALNAAKLEFKKNNLMEFWDNAKKDLKEWTYFHESDLFNGARFLIDCIKIA